MKHRERNPVGVFERDGRLVVLLTLREATALDEYLERKVNWLGDADLNRARRVLRNQVEWLADQGEMPGED